MLMEKEQFTNFPATKETHLRSLYEGDGMPLSLVSCSFPFGCSDYLFLLDENLGILVCCVLLCPNHKSEYSIQIMFSSTISNDKWLYTIFYVTDTFLYLLYAAVSFAPKPCNIFEACNNWYHSILLFAMNYSSAIHIAINFYATSYWYSNFSLKPWLFLTSGVNR